MDLLMMIAVSDAFRDVRKEMRRVREKLKVMAWKQELKDSVKGKAI